MGGGVGRHGRPGSQAALRDANRSRIVAVLGEGDGLTQAQIARRTGLAPSTVSNIVRELESQGAISAPGGGGGRRRFQLVRASGLVAGLDFGHRHLSVAVADLGHRIIGERRVEFGAGLSAVDGIEMGATLLAEALADLRVDLSDVHAVGVGLPAPIDSESGEVGALSILPGWVGVSAAELAADRLGVPVVVENDANLGALAEHLWGAGAGCDNLAYVKLAEGVGAGLILNGDLYRGRNGTAGEVGHTTIEEFGKVCRCGNRGCLETIVAARAVVELLTPSLGGDLTIPRIVELAEAGNYACARVLTDTGRLAGVAMANLCNLVDPELIVIGGELAAAGELLFAPMREAVRRGGIPSATATLSISPASLGAKASVLGAVALAIRQVSTGAVADVVAD